MKAEDKNLGEKKTKSVIRKMIREEKLAIVKEVQKEHKNKKDKEDG
jgi:hypothetical protein